jgi:hypothetical protein
LGNLEEGSFTGDFESWMKGALEMKHLSEEAPWRGLGGAPSLGTLEDMLGRFLEVGISLWVPLFMWVCGGRFIYQGLLVDEWRALVLVISLRGIP